MTIAQLHRDTLLSYYRGAIDRSIEAYGSLSDEEWAARGRGSDWTAHDYLCHIVTGQEHWGNVVTRLNLEGKPVEIAGLTSVQAIDAFNRKNLEDARGLRAGELLARFRLAFDEHLAMLAGLSDEDLARPARLPLRAAVLTLAQVFATLYIHLSIHYQDIRRIIRPKRALPHWADLTSEDELRDLLARQFALLPSVFVPERAGDLRATIEFEITGKGGGRWAVAIEGGPCRFIDGGIDKPTLRLRISARDWIDFATQELKPPRALLTRRLRLSGNFLLAMRLNQLFEIG